MANLKLIQLSTSECKLDSVSDFCLISNGNSMVLRGNSCDVAVLELMYNCDTAISMPYSIKKILVAQHKPISDVIRNINLVKIYESASVQESQELALDLIYTAESSVDPLKAKFLQADIITINDINICCVLTTYGYCEIYKKASITKEWTAVGTNLSTILITDLFPITTSPSLISDYDSFKNFTNKYIITCFVMSQHDSHMFIYLGTAAGHVVALKYNESLSKFEIYCYLKTSLIRICCIVTYNNLILVGCDHGKVILVKINFEDISLQELDYLWSKADRMSCRKAIFTYNEDSRSYLLIFCKTAHVLVYHLDIEGTILSSSTLYVRGIKITGIESINESEFIITTIMGTVKLIKVECPTKEEIHIEQLVIDHEFDSSNYQILGIAASQSKTLWSFILFRNKDYMVQSKFTATSAFLNTCKLSDQDSIAKLNNLSIKNMKVVQDLILVVNIDIMHGKDIGEYTEYVSLDKLKDLDDISDAFLQKLQIKFIIMRKLAKYQNIKYKKVKEETKKGLLVLEIVLQMLHILERLRYLRQHNLKEIKFTKFQEISIVCMQLQFSYLLGDIATIDYNDEEDFMRTVVVRLITFIKNVFSKNEFDTNSFTNTMEYCIMCSQAINNFKKCEQEHEIKRCSVSFTQLSLFKTKYCPHCYALVRNDEEANLQELYTTDDYITCIYCRFLFQEDEF